MNEHYSCSSRLSVNKKSKSTDGEKNFLTLIETSITGMILLDRAGLVLYANPSAEKLFGQSRDVLLGSPFGFPIVTAKTSEILIPRQNSLVTAELQVAEVQWEGHDAYLASLQDVTDRKRAENSIKQSELFLRSTLDGLSAHIALLDEQGNILHVNRAWREFSQQNGAMPDMVCEGRNYLQVCDSASGKNSEEAVQFANGIRGVISKKLDCFSIEYPCHSFSKKRWFIGRVTPMPSDDSQYVVIAHEEITERKMSEQEMIKLKRCVENTSSAIVITNTRGLVEYVNPAFTEITGYTLAELIGKSPRILKSGFHDAAFYQDMWRTITQGKAWRGEIRNKKKNGQFFWEHATISPVIDTNGSICNYVAIKEDISDKMELEQIKADIERIIRHDLKTPLNGIVGLPQILKMDENLTEEQVELVEAIEDSGYRMLRMIDSSLDLFKMETGKYEYDPKSVNILPVIEQIKMHNSNKISTKKLVISIEVDGIQAVAGQDFTVQSEERLLYSLLSNLILNAIEASPQGKDVLVELATASQKNIAIRNKGAVPVGVRDHFFDKYKTHGKTFGTGLGTYSAKLLADTMGYDIKMQTSEKNNETVITVFFAL